jgi:hypothetical protein
MYKFMQWFVEFTFRCIFMILWQILEVTQPICRFQLILWIVQLRFISRMLLII